MEKSLVKKERKQREERKQQQEIFITIVEAPGRCMCIK